MLARRSSNLLRRVHSVQRSMRLDSRAISKTVQQDWSALLSSLDADARPMVITAGYTPFEIVAVNSAWTSLCGFSAQMRRLDSREADFSPR